MAGLRNFTVIAWSRQATYINVKAPDDDEAIAVALDGATDGWFVLPHSEDIDFDVMPTDRFRQSYVPAEEDRQEEASP